MAQDDPYKDPNLEKDIQEATDGLRTPFGDPQWLKDEIRRDMERASRDRLQYQWGNKYGMADEDVARYRGLGGQWAGMQAPQIDYAGADRYAGMGDAARAQGLEALGLQRDAALGSAPSKAAILMKQANDQAVASQLAMAAGARGPAAMAQAQQAALGNQSAMSTTNAANMGALRAQEMAQAREAFAQQAAALRAQDAQAQGLSADQAYRQAAMEMQQRQLGLQGQQAYEQMAWDTRSAQSQLQRGLSDDNFRRWSHQGDWGRQSTRNAQDFAIGLLNVGQKAAKK